MFKKISRVLVFVKECYTSVSFFFGTIPGRKLLLPFLLIMWPDA